MLKAVLPLLQQQRRYMEAALVAESLLEVSGSANAADACAALCVLQSCLTAQTGLAMVMQTRDPAAREVAALRLLTATARQHGHAPIVPRAEAAKEFLSTLSVAYKRLDVSTRYSDLVAALPSDSLALVLQLSLSQRELYAALIPSAARSESP